MKIVQIMPAPGWYAIHIHRKPDGTTSHEAVLLSAWALVIQEDDVVPTKDDADFPECPSVIGLEASDDRFLNFPDKDTFVHYSPEHEAKRYDSRWD